MTAPLLKTLLANPGLYVGLGTGHDGTVTVARIAVTVLPSGRAVSFDYEARHPANPLQHSEHSILGYSPSGELMLISSNPPDESLSILRETEPGWFLNDPTASKFPIGIRIECDEPGVLRYDWWYSMPGQPLERHDDTVVRLLPNQRA
jgi:hypothetical protein